jgi:hypothetical protein
MYDSNTPNAHSAPRPFQPSHKAEILRSARHPNQAFPVPCRGNDKRDEIRETLGHGLEWALLQILLVYCDVGFGKEGVRICYSSVCIVEEHDSLIHTSYSLASKITNLFISAKSICLYMAALKKIKNIQQRGFASKACTSF